MFAEDLSVFFNPAEHGIKATIDGRTQTVLFDDAYTAAQYAGVAIDASRPAVRCITALNPGLKADMEATVNGIDYVIKAVEPDGQGTAGLTRLVLEQLYATEAP